MTLIGFRTWHITLWKYKDCKLWRHRACLCTWESEEGVEFGDRRPSIHVPGSYLQLISGLRKKIVDHIAVNIFMILWNWTNIKKNLFSFHEELIGPFWLYLPLISVTMIETLHSVCLLWLLIWNIFGWNSFWKVGFYCCRIGL